MSSFKSKILPGLLACWTALGCFGQTILTADGLVCLKKGGSSAGGGGGGNNTYALLAHSTGSATGVNPATTTAVNITGAKLIVVSIGIANSGGATDVNPHDAQGNTWVHITPNKGGSSGLGTNELWYCINPTTSSSYSVSATRNQTTICMAVFSCTGTPVFDSSTGNQSGSFSTLSTGSLTASGTELFIATEGSFLNAAATLSINSSFTVTDQIDRFNSAVFCGLAYKNSSSAENPTWTSSAGGQAGGVILATFK